MLDAAAPRFVHWLIARFFARREERRRRLVPENIRESSHALNNAAMEAKGASVMLRREVDVLGDLAVLIRTRGHEGGQSARRWRHDDDQDERT